MHKGLPFSGYEQKYSSCRDVGVVARLYPDVNFVVYHAGYDHRGTEGPYDPKAAKGIDSLIRSLEENGLGPKGNVFVDLGSIWRILMRHPTEAAHALGKLIRHLGPDRVLWGSDAIWYGSPQDQIQAFRAFQIAEQLRERHSYPELTPEIRAKVLGLNALAAFRVSPEDVRRKAEADRIGRIRAAYREDPRPSHLSLGPRTDAEFRALQRLSDGLPT